MRARDDRTARGVSGARIRLPGTQARRAALGRRGERPGPGAQRLRSPPSQLLITHLYCCSCSEGKLRHRLSQTALAGIVCCAAIAPWSVRNCLELDGCALISTTVAWNGPVIGALSETGRFRPLTPEDGCRDIDGPVAQDRCWADRGMQAIESDPWRWLARIPDKLRHTYNHESFAVAYLAEAQPAAWDEARKFRAMNLITGLHHLLCFIAALSAVSRVGWRSGRQAWAQLALVGGLLVFGAYALSLPDKPLYWIAVAIPVLALLRLPGSPPLDGGLAYLYGLLALTSLTHMIFGDDRYHLTISPVLFLHLGWSAAFRRPTTPALRARLCAPDELTHSPPLSGCYCAFWNCCS